MVYINFQKPFLKHRHVLFVSISILPKTKSQEHSAVAYTRELLQTQAFDWEELCVVELVCTMVNEFPLTLKDFHCYHGLLYSHTIVSGRVPVSLSKLIFLPLLLNDILLYSFTHT